MSIHPSLASKGLDKKQRSVLKRTERLRTMLEKEQWKEGDKVYGLPKIKTVRLKIKKEKVKEAVEAVTAETPEGGAQPATTAQPQKEQPASGKAQEKQAKK